eukprot:246394-Lingulodinium_polyedra.AAC.1
MGRPNTNRPRGPSLGLMSASCAGFRPRCRGRRSRPNARSTLPRSPSPPGPGARGHGKPRGWDRAQHPV